MPSVPPTGVFTGIVRGRAGAGGTWEGDRARWGGATDFFGDAEGKRLPLQQVAIQLALYVIC